MATLKRVCIVSLRYFSESHNKMRCISIFYVCLIWTLLQKKHNWTLLKLSRLILYKEKIEKPRNFYQNHLFRPETSCQSSAAAPKVTEDSSEVTAGTAAAGLTSCDNYEVGTAQIDKDIKQRCHIIQMTYFKAYVQVKQKIKNTVNWRFRLFSWRPPIFQSYLVSALKV